MKRTITIDGLDCAACAAELETSLKKINGVIDASVSYVMQKINLEYADEEALQKSLTFISRFEEVRIINDGSGCAAPQNAQPNAQPQNAHPQNGGSALGNAPDNTHNDKGANGGVSQSLVKIENLHCAACAAELETSLKKINGVIECRVDFITQRVTLVCVDRSALKKAVEKISRFEKVRVLNADELFNRAEKPQGKPHDQAHDHERDHEHNHNHAASSESIQRSAFARNKREFFVILVAAVLYACGLVCTHAFHGVIARTLSYVFFGAAYLVVGYPVLLSTAKNIARGKFFDENFLMTMASVGAFALGDFAEGVAVMLLYQLGEWLQAIAVGSSRKSLGALMALKSESANLVVREPQKNAAESNDVAASAADKEEIIAVPPERLSVGDEVLVKAGEKIPCDGVLLSETAQIDTKSLTGESALKEVQTGGELLSGCINSGDVFRMRVTKEYKDSAVKRILDLVENSSAQKAKSEKFITKFSRVYTPVVCLAALFVAFGIPLFDAWLGGGYLSKFTLRVRAALNFLVVSCPCALIISVPLTYFCGIGACARAGVLVKGATHLDALAAAQNVAFDKTGTLTKGNFTVLSSDGANGVSAKETLFFASLAESQSSHPIARAFDGVFEQLQEERNATDLSGNAAQPTEKTAIKRLFANEYRFIRARESAGGGIETVVADREGKETSIVCGKASFLRDKGIEPLEKLGEQTQIYVAVDGRFVGIVEIGDSVRENAASSIRQLKRTGVKKTVMLTGDNAARAEKIAKQLGIDEWHAQLLPDEKLNRAQTLKENGGVVYVGDGINDAPVMAAADCAVSMGKLGAAAAVEASDLVLVSDDLSALVRGRRIAKKVRAIVKQNIVFSIACKIACLVASLFGVLPLFLAVFADVGVMMLAVLNALRTSRTSKVARA